MTEELDGDSWRVDFSDSGTECTPKCRSTMHGSQVFSIGTRGTDRQVVNLWIKTCENYGHVKDELGRTALHAAASYGLLKVSFIHIQNKTHKSDVSVSVTPTPRFWVSENPTPDTNTDTRFFLCRISTLTPNFLVSRTPDTDTDVKIFGVRIEHGH